uniref:Uncharacterized protein n=1 Tax=Arundo donax TaxID=35708 RepID=A0A0A8ZCQ7_ARUDO
MHRPLAHAAAVAVGGRESCGLAGLPPSSEQRLGDHKQWSRRVPRRTNLS